MKTRYERNYDDDFLPSDFNAGGRFRSYLDNGLNYSFNYFYGYDANPHVNLHWENDSGQRLFVDETVSVAAGTGTNVFGTRDIKVLQFRNADGSEYYGANTDPAPGLVPVTPANNGGAATLVLKRNETAYTTWGPLLTTPLKQLMFHSLFEASFFIKKT